MPPPHIQSSSIGVPAALPTPATAASQYGVAPSPTALQLSLLYADAPQEQPGTPILLSATHPGVYEPEQVGATKSFPPQPHFTVPPEAQYPYGAVPEHPLSVTVAAPHLHSHIFEDELHVIVPVGDAPPH